jgi:hypothetical protein
MWRLVVDSLLRQWPYISVFMLLLTPAEGNALYAPRTFFAASAGLASLIGLTGLQQVTPRLIRQLPLSRVQLWRVLWMRSVIAAPLIVAAGKLLAWLLDRKLLSPAELALSTVLDVAYAGGTTLFFVVASLPDGRLAKVPGWSIIQRLAVLALVLGIPFVPYMLGERLPIAWSEVSAVHLAVLAALFSITGATFFYRPGAATESTRRVEPRPEAPARQTRSTPLTRGLSGFPRLLLNELAWTGWIGLMTVALVGLGAIGLAGFLAGSWRFFETRVPIDAAVDGVFFLLAALMIVQASRFGEIIRHLRVLPLSAARINITMLAWPLVLWTFIWCGLLGLHALMSSGEIESLRLGYFALLVGISAFAKAVTLRWGPSASAWGVLVIPLIPMMNIASTTAGDSLWLGAGGAAAFAGAAALNAYTLARGSAYAFRKRTALV